jgi:hypothetical protein
VGIGVPFDVPAVAAVESLALDAPVTFLAGDNGTGKSTLVEAIAEAIGFSAQGGELERSGELPAVPRAVLGGALEPVLSSHKPRNGYFLRAESFFNIAAFVDSGALFAPDLSLYGDVPLHEQSHGEGFLAYPARLPRGAHLRARRRRHRSLRLRRPRRRTAHARVPRRAGALPARSARRLIAVSRRDDAASSPRAPCSRV